MHCPGLDELPPPPAGQTGWPWTTESPPLPDATPEPDLWPQISIVTPSFNHGHFLEETIRSVLLQGYPNLEYLVIDGGSTDNSVEIIRQYEPWLAYWVSEPDRGQSHAINKGLRQAQGAILGWLNSDDVYCPATLHRVAGAMQRQPAAGLAYGLAEMIDRASTPTGRLLGQDFSLAQLLDGTNPVAQPSAFFTRFVVDQVGHLDESLHYAMDFDLWLRIALVSDIIYLGQVLSRFRLHPESKTYQGRLPFELEKYRAILAALAATELPPDVQETIGSKALSGLFLRMALFSHGQGNDQDARRYAAGLIRLDGRRALERSEILRLLQCMVGRKPALAAKSLHAQYLGITARHRPRVSQGLP